MSIQLRLDPQALAAMFPEGTEARVELQKAVIHEFVKQHLRVASLGDDVQKVITQAFNESRRVSENVLKDAQRIALEQVGLKSSGSWGDRYDLLPAGQNAVYEAVKKGVDANIDEKVQTCIDRRMRRLEQEIEAEVTKRLDAFTEVLATDVVRERLNAALKGLQ